MTQREIGPSDVTYKTGDCVRILTDCRYGWQYNEQGTATTYDKRIKYYEGEIIFLKEGEWQGLGTMQIRPVPEKAYYLQKEFSSKHRVFACGVKRRFGIWWDSFRRKVGSFLYNIIEIPCAIVSELIEGLFRLLGLKKLADYSGGIAFLVLLVVLWAII